MTIKKTSAQKPVTENPWETLKSYTDARIGLGRAGISIPTSHLLAFQLAHAQAQDAVHTPLDKESLLSNVKNSDSYQQEIKHSFFLHSRAKNRAEYLQRPDFGRRLNQASATELQTWADEHNNSPDLAIAIVDGLSARAVEQNALPFISELITQLKTSEKKWQLAPLMIVEQGRVAIGDEIGEKLNAKCIVVLIGERPGLSSPDSMGLYLTWAPSLGLTDSRRNCISNIRLAGVDYATAARKAFYLLDEARNKKISGVALKDRTEETPDKITEAKGHL